MSRFAATVVHDARIQYRNGFYWVSLVLLPIWAVLLIAIRDSGAVAMEPVLVLIGATNLVTTTFYFMAGLVLLEKSDGVLDGLVVTPLRGSEYLVSKILTLAGLAAVETGLVILLVHQGTVDLVALFGGMLLLGAILAALGFVAVARHDAINTFLPPSILWTTLFSLPLLDYFGIWESPVFLAHPLTPALSVLDSAFRPDWGMPLVDLGLLLAWGLASGVWARATFTRFVARTAG